MLIKCLYKTFCEGGRALIEVKNLVKRYGDHLAVNRLSFTVEEGQIYGFLGPNGAGKSTTMNIITGYLAATEGEVVINGHNILEEPEQAKKCIGYLPEIPPLYMDMTVLEYLKFAAELKKIPKGKREEHIQEIMKLVKITDMQNRLIKNLSKGYKQRVGLAQAVLGYPPIIILDEPTVGLDPKQIIEIRDLIKSLGKKHTVILSSHILSEVSAVCDYVMIIANGKLVASDTPDNLSRLTLGSNTVEVSVKGSRNDVVKVISGIKEIQGVKYKNSEVPDCVDVSITTAKDCDIREKLFYRLAEAKCPILQMNSSTMSLEVVFLELTGNPAKAAKNLERQMGQKSGGDGMEEDFSEEDWYGKNYSYDAKANVVTTLKGGGMTFDENNMINGFDLDASSFGIAGTGFGVDLGASYSIFNNLTVSAAVLDLGVMKWNKNNTTMATVEGHQNVTISEDNYDQYIGGDILSLDRFDFKKDEEADYKSSTKLSTTILLAAEYGLLNNKLSVGAVYSSRFVQPKTQTELTFLATLRPSNAFNAAISYSPILSGGKSFGLALKLGPIFAGTDYMYFGGNSKTINGFIGLSLPLGGKRKPFSEL